MADGIRSYGDFFRWCASAGLVLNGEIAHVFGRTPQTVRNWRRVAASGTDPQPPRNVVLSCRGYEELCRLSPVPYPGASHTEASSAWFGEWLERRGLHTLDATGRAFGVTRQAVHNWNVRKRLPPWLWLACVGFDALEDDADDVKAFPST